MFMRETSIDVSGSTKLLFLLSVSIQVQRLQ